MAYTKRQIVNIAMDAIGLGPDVYTATPDDIATALRRLDAMMAQWSALGLRMGYQIHDGADDADPGADSGLPTSAVDGVALQLAILIAPSYGKQIAPETRVAATRAKIALDAIFGTLPPTLQMPAGVPMGAGHRRVWPGHSTFSGQPANPVTRGPNGDTLDT